MQKFSFESTLARIEIEGKAYEFDPTDAELTDRVIQAAKKVSSVSPGKASDATMTMLSKELRNTVGAVLGEKAQNEIFAGRKPNIIQELRLINALVKAREEAGVDAEIDALLNNIGTSTLDD